MAESIGLYIHIPFCKSKCNYCDFNSYPGKDDLIGPYFSALEKEIRFRSGKTGGHSIETVFIGGGTPSLADEGYICKLLNLCRQSFRIDSNAEISIESNPGTLSCEKLSSYRINGINRLSIGLQAWQDRLLKDLGRIHGRDDFLYNLNLASKAGFRNINVDLIFGLPGQTMNDWIETVNNVVKKEISHISCYSLKIEDGTVFGEKLRLGLLHPADDELDRRMYGYAVERLREYGFRHYEISNFSRQGFECKHNLIYWKAREYIGIGAGAHSYFDNRRFNNVYGIEEYIEAASNPESLQENGQTIDKRESMSEYMILGLRLTDGVSTADFKERYGEDLYAVFGRQIEKLVKKRLLEPEGDRIRLTSYGLDIANEVFTEFV